MVCLEFPRRVSLALLCLAFVCVAPSHGAVVLQYHHVDSETPASTSTPPGRFAMHLDYLADNGFEVVRLERLVARIRQGLPLPDRTVAITFDDGYVSIYETAFPMLREKGWPFTVFVNSEPHDQRKPLFMSWDQLRELHAGGATIANHTVGHPSLLEFADGVSTERRREWIADQVEEAQGRIEQEIGTAPMLFAYPFGEFDRTVLDVVGELGFAGFGQHSGPLAPFDDLRALPRFPFGGDYGDAQDFTTKVNSLPLPLAATGPALRLESADGQALEGPLLDGPEARPVLLLRFEDGFDPGRLACFASGQGQAAVTSADGWVRVQAERPFTTGRARYNCTAPSGKRGRFHWFSQPWIIR